jgi:phosphoribosylformimino-5-aminoimidazole carboxamide ribotide isomerase
VRLIPAIDLKDGQCVRLFKGRFEDKTVYSHDPVGVARRWAAEGAEVIHLVDLDASVGNNSANFMAIEAIRRAVDVELELGGGLKTMESLQRWFEAGIDRLVLGTAVCFDRALVEQAATRWPDCIYAALDAAGRQVRVRGWLEDGGADLLEAAESLPDIGISLIIYTDVDRDGTQTGPNLEMADRVAEVSGLPIIISGGISGLEDLRQICAHQQRFFDGVISGKALYEGTLDFREGQAILSARPGSGR